MTKASAPQTTGSDRITRSIHVMRADWSGRLDDPCIHLETHGVAWSLRQRAIEYPPLTG